MNSKPCLTQNLSTSCTNSSPLERGFLQMSSCQLRRFFWIAIALTSISCSKITPSNSRVASPQFSEPVALKIIVQPAQDRSEQKRMIPPLKAHLEKVLGQPVDFMVAKDYEDSINVLVAGQVNAAYMGGASYFEALERGAKVKPLVAPIDRYTLRPWYRACILVPAKSSIKTLADLKNKRVAFVNRSSTSGYLKPLAALRELGIQPERDLAAVIFGDTHDRTAAMLGKAADAIATNLATYTRWKQQGKLSEQAVRIIWQSDPFPHSPVLISETLPPELVEKLKEAFLTTPEGIQDLMGAETIGYTLVEAEDYEAVQDLRQELNLTKEP